MDENTVCVYVISNGRPDNVATIDLALSRSNYRGPWYIVLDDEDPTREQYERKYGSERIVVFPKQETINSFDIGDNFGLSGSCVPRAALWNIARDHGYRYFLVLDDDYTDFTWRFDENNRPAYGFKVILDFDEAINAMLDYYKTLPPQILTLSILQKGEMIGGWANQTVDAIKVKRKAMNFFLCDTEREFVFPGRLNEDVNAYTEVQRRGSALMMINIFCLNQKATQQTKGGLTEDYIEHGTYTKSFYSVMRCPSGVKVSMLVDRNANPRIHHKVNYKRVAPAIIPERYRRTP